MATLFQPRILVLGVATIMLMIIGGVSWRLRPKRGARSLAALMGAATIWAIGSVHTQLAMTYTGNLLATNIGYLGISLVPVAWIVLSLEYAGKEAWITRETVAALLAIPITTQFVIWTNSVHELFWRIEGLLIVDSTQLLSISSYGPWFWVHTVHSYLLLGAGTIIFLRSIAVSQQIYRRQVAMMVAAVVIPWAGNAIKISQAFSMVMDPTPFLFVISGGLFIAALFRFRLLDLVPIARDTIIDEMHDGIIVLDSDNYIVDINSATESLLGIDPEVVVGLSATEVFNSCYVDRYRDVYEGSENIVVDIDGKQRVLNLRISPLQSHTGERRGRVVIIRDTTIEEEQRRRLKQQNDQLKRQNDHLEQFASIVSHDLQGPLSIAQGYLGLVHDECESEHVDRISTAHDEMEALIDDLLTLAREGQMVGETEVVPLDTVVNATLSADHDEMTVEIESETYTVKADPGRLQQLFENLFKNAVEHAGPDVTIRVGPLEEETGFYIEDDGPGIPPSVREHVFESGYTRSSSGTGLGLAIVKSIANAHGGDVSVTDSENGGARFEIVIDDEPSRASESFHE
ncbi:histidine kinase N-terminal 7TM domain-containing protein [Halocatena marina]|uniref:histidine kinase N-terminal 7TM domain-containing protein n=2 Tax=Halocatena marina TaxID=2934937 RepID=UPI0034A3530B